MVATEDQFSWRVIGGLIDLVSAAYSFVQAW
jgi:hypothetical protein